MWTSSARLHLHFLPSRGSPDPLLSSSGDCAEHVIILMYHPLVHYIVKYIMQTKYKTNSFNKHWIEQTLVIDMKVVDINIYQWSWQDYDTLNIALQYFFSLFSRKHLMFEVNNCVTVRNSIWFYSFINLDIWFYTVFWPATKNLLHCCFACLRRWWRGGGFIWVYCWEFGFIHECCYEAMVQNIGDIPPLNWNLSLNTLHINVRHLGVSVPVCEVS